MDAVRGAPVTRLMVAALLLLALWPLLAVWGFNSGAEVGHLP